MRWRSFRPSDRYGMAWMALLALLSLSAFAWQKMELNAARTQLAQAVRDDALPPRLAVQSDLPFLEARLKTEAVAASISLTIMNDGAMKGGDAAGLEVLASGSQDAVMTFAERLESGATGMVLARWRIEPAQDGVLLTMRVEPAYGLPRVRGLPKRPALAPLFAPRVAWGDASPPIGSRPVLVGVAGRLPDDAEALVRAPGEPVRTMRPGDIIIGWQLVEIGPDYIRFTRNGQTYVSTLTPIS